MSIDVTAAVHIRRPLPHVAAYMIDPRHDPEWIGGVREARALGDEPLGPGSRVARVARFLGRRIEYVNEIVALDAERCLDMRSVAAPFPMRITYSFVKKDGGTDVRNRVRGDVHGFFALFGPLLAPLVRRSVQRDLERLRDLLEDP
ncbi:MAG: hypothetical protein QOH46_3726 [Solirubrobacteraceae bacterium]|nr:hypothetical protein [Solirubrobacteraceae bacterium]